MRLHRRSCRPGQVLIEFAIIALVLYLLLAATIEFGRAMFGAQTIQAAADLAAREISRTPLSVSTYSSLCGTGSNDTTAAMNDPVVRQRVFDERLLVINLDGLSVPLTTLLANFPVVNQQLFPLMIFEQIPSAYLMTGSGAGSAVTNILRYPGALVTAGDESAVSSIPFPPGFTDTGLRVAIPLIEGYTVAPTGLANISTVGWVPVLEEITPGAFSVAYQPPAPGSGPSAGTVGVRLNYPFQAAALSQGYIPPGASPFEPGIPVQAIDGLITTDPARPLPPGRSLVVPADPDPSPNKGLQPYGGSYGLGFQLALPYRPPMPPPSVVPLRPFRSLQSGQAVYRREVFNP